jgi:toxin ParE1/3/4
LKVAWSPLALQRIEEIWKHIALDNPAAATRAVRRIQKATKRLAFHPHSGRPGRVPGFRELVVAGTRYLLPYHFVQGTIEIVTVIHGAQEWPEGFS